MIDANHVLLDAGETLYHYRQLNEPESYLEGWSKAVIAEQTYYYKYFWRRYEDFRNSFLYSYPKKGSLHAGDIVRLASFQTTRPLNLKQMNQNENIVELRANLPQIIVQNFDEFDGWIKDHDPKDKKTEVLLWTKGDQEKPVQTHERWNLTTKNVICGSTSLPTRTWLPGPPGEGDW